MFTTAILLMKGFFGGFFRILFSDWRITLLAVIIAVAGVFAWKYHGVQKHLEQTEQTLKVEQENNQVLRNNLQVAKDANEQNQRIIGQLQADAESTSNQVASLNNRIHARDRAVTDLKGKLAGMTGPITKVPPRISYSLEAAQQLRAAGDAK